MVADGMLHGAFEGLVGGGDRQEEVFGTRLLLGEESLILPRLSADHLHGSSSSIPLFFSWWGGGDRMEEGDGGRREEASGWELLSSCGETKEVL